MTITIERTDLAAKRAAWKRHSFAKAELMDVYVKALETAEALRKSPDADVRLALVDLCEMVASLAFICSDWHIEELMDIEREAGA